MTRRASVDTTAVPYSAGSAGTAGDRFRAEQKTTEQAGKGK